jgi:hypothetical protein
MLIRRTKTYSALFVCPGFTLNAPPAGKMTSGFSSYNWSWLIHLISGAQQSPPSMHIASYPYTHKIQLSHFGSSIKLFEYMSLR